MTLIKTSILSLIATFFKMLSGLVINKVISVYIGPSGLALIGQFQNFIQITLVAAQGAINSGVVKYTAEYHDDAQKLSFLFSTAFKLSLVSSILTSAALIFSSSHLSVEIFLTEEYTYVFYIFGFTIILFVFNNLLLSILNGLKKIPVFIKINISQSIFSLFFTSILIFTYKIEGAMIALATNQSITLLVTLHFIRKENLINWKLFNVTFDKKIAKKLLKFSLMAITSAITIPTSQYIIREFLTNNQGIDNAGYWQGINYISTTYLNIVTIALGIYYLPRLSEIKHGSELLSEIKKGYKIILPIAIISGLFIFSFRYFIITALFSDKFLSMEPLFFWQIIGDIFKIASWLFAYVMIAKSMSTVFIFSEIIFSTSLVFLTILLVGYFGMIGSTYAYSINYIIYLIFTCIVVKKFINKNLQPDHQ